MGSEQQASIDAREAIKQQIDIDLEEAELLEPLDRARFTLDLYQQVTGEQPSIYGQHYVGENIEPPTGWGEHLAFTYGLPIQRYSGGPTDGALTPNHVFVPIKQEHMWRVSLERSPYLYAGMSDCSLVIGKTDTDIWAAHVGFSKNPFQISQTN